MSLDVTVLRRQDRALGGKTDRGLPLTGCPRCRGGQVSAASVAGGRLLVLVQTRRRPARGLVGGGDVQHREAPAWWGPRTSVSGSSAFKWDTNSFRSENSVVASQE